MDIKKYQKIFKEKGVDMTDEEMDEFMYRMDNFCNLLFKKYMEKIKKDCDK